MKRLLPLLSALALAALLLPGCASFKRTRTPPPRAFALAVTVYGSLQPTAAQFAAIQAAAARELAAVGWVLVSDLSLADQIIRVDFTPNPADPERSGRVVVLEFRDNPLRALTTINPPVARSYSYASTHYAPSYRYSDPYYMYSSYSDGYTYDAPSGTLTPVPPSKVTPPPTPPVHTTRHTPRNDDEARRTGISRHGGSETRTRGHDDNSRRHDPPPTYSRSDSGYSGSSGSSSSSGSGSSSSYSSSDSSSYSSSGSSSSYSSPSDSGSSSSGGSTASSHSDVLR